MDTFAANYSVAGIASTADGHNLRTMLLSGDYFLGSVVAVTLAKLVLRLRPLLAAPATNRAAAEAMLVSGGIVVVFFGGFSFFPCTPIT